MIPPFPPNDTAYPAQGRIDAQFMGAIRLAAGDGRATQPVVEVHGNNARFTVTHGSDGGEGVTTIRETLLGTDAPTWTVTCTPPSAATRRSLLEHLQERLNRPDSKRPTQTIEFNGLTTEFQDAGSAEATQQPYFGTLLEFRDTGYGFKWTNAGDEPPIITIRIPHGSTVRISRHTS